MAFKENLRLARERAGKTQREVAAELGVTNSTYCGYETGKRQPDVEKIKMIARILRTPSDTLLETNAYPPNTAPFPGVAMKPRLGTIACGMPVLAEQNIEGYDAVPDWVKCDFTLVCRGDSMIGAHIRDGDVVCIKQQEEVQNGQIAAVLINDAGDDGATLKRVRYIENGVALWPENPAYEPMIFTGEDANRVKILGLATHFIGTVR